MVSSSSFLDLMLAAADSRNEGYVETYVNSSLISLIKTADPDVKQLFFPTEKGGDFDSITLLTYEELSARYILYVISGLQQYPDLAQMVSEKSYQQVNRFLTLHADSLGLLFLKLYLDANLKLQQTAGERESYFIRLTRQLTTTNFEAVTKAVSISHSPAPAQLIIAALKILDSGAYNSVLLSWAQSEFFTAEFADLDLLHLLENYPWLDRYHADILSESFGGGIIEGIKRNPEKTKDWIRKNVIRYGLF